MSSINYGKGALLLGIASIVIASLLTSQVVYSQTPDVPFEKAQILGALKVANRKSPDERKAGVQAIVDEVSKKGVNFEMTSDDETEFKNAGATPELLKVIRENYRPVGQSQTPGAACKQQAQIRLFPVTKEQALADKVVNLKEKISDDLHYEDVDGPWNNGNPDDNPPTSEIRWFFKEDKKCADQLKRELKTVASNMTFNVIQGKNAGDPPPRHTIHVYVK